MHFCDGEDCDECREEARWAMYWDSLTSAEKADEIEAMGLYASEADY